MYTHSNVTWDLTLTGVEVLLSQAAILGFQNLCVRAYKVSGTVPDVVANVYALAAEVTNVATGVKYRNTGSTLTPAWSVV